MHHRGRDRADALARDLPGSVALQADLREEGEVDALFDAARAELGGLDVCAAVAGVWPEEDVPVWDLPPARWEETLRANLTATYLTARGFLREVERNGHGSLVLVGSTAAVFGEAGHADYAAAKSAIVGGLLLSLKNEIGRIAPGRVNAVCPGWTVSPMTRSTLDDPAVLDRATRTMALRKAAARRTSRGRSSSSPRTSSRGTSPARSCWSPAEWKAGSCTRERERAAHAALFDSDSSTLLRRAG